VNFKVVSDSIISAPHDLVLILADVVGNIGSETAEYHDEFALVPIENDFRSGGWCFGRIRFQCADLNGVIYRSKPGYELSMDFTPVERTPGNAKLVPKPVKGNRRFRRV